MDQKEILINVVDLSMSAVEVSVSTAHILSGTQEVQKASTSMASAVEELTASIGEIESSANRTTQAVGESSRLTTEGMHELSDLANKIVETGAVFEMVSSKTAELERVVDSLGKIVDMISKIAGQTNLLALNATIEAARAGEHGKGFSVVAGEVKSLSNQTSDATKKIQEQIKQLHTTFGDMREAVSGTQATIGTVVEKAHKVSHDFEQINSNSVSIETQVSELAHIISQQRIAVELLSRNMNVVAQKGNENLDAVNALADQTDHSVKLIEDWRQKLAAQDIPNQVIYLAQADHLLWKKRLLDMAVGRSGSKASDFSDHTLCRLGKWYYQQATSDAYASLPDFKAIEEPHKKVHHYGIEAARLFEQGKIEEGMRLYAELEAASQEVIKGLKKLADINPERALTRELVAA